MGEVMGPNYNIQCMRLLHELRTTFTNIPDDAVRQCMKKHNNEKERCVADLKVQAENYIQSRYRSRQRLKLCPRRYSMDVGGMAAAHMAIAAGGNSSSASMGHRRRRSIGSGSHYGGQGVHNLSSVQLDKIRSDLESRMECATTTIRANRSTAGPVRRRHGTGSSASSARSGSDGGPGRPAKLFAASTSRAAQGRLSETPDSTSPNKELRGDPWKPSLSESLLSSKEHCDVEDDSPIPYSPTPDPVTAPYISSIAREPKRRAPRPLSLQQLPDLDLIPTVVLTPESPPKDRLEAQRLVETLYSPHQHQSNTIQDGCGYVPEDCMYTVVPGQTNGGSNPPSITDEKPPHLIDDEKDSEATMMIYGNNTTITSTCLDIDPVLSGLNLPFGNSTSTNNSSVGEESGASTTVTQSSLSTGVLHFLRQSNDGNLSLATTTFCGFEQTILSPCDTTKPNSKSSTVLYTVNTKPLTCEYPFRKVFAKRKEFYESRESRDCDSPETSSKRLVWRPCNHACRRNSLCPDTNHCRLSSSSSSTTAKTSCDAAQVPRYFTVFANIQPFEAFSIRHDLQGQDESAVNPSAVNLMLSPDSAEPRKLIPDSQGIMYHSRVDLPDEGARAHLEVKVRRDGSTITTKRTGSSDCTSNEICVQLLDGGSTVNIQQSQVSLPVPSESSKLVRPTSLHIPGSKYATASPHSVGQGRGTSPLSVPRYNSLPNLKGVATEGVAGMGGWNYQSHPRDEEKRLAYTRALLSHQMEQLFKLESTLRAEKGEVQQLRQEVTDLEVKWKRRCIKSQPAFAETGVKQLEKDIDSLRGECGQMSERVTNLTGGAVVGETSINYSHYLNRKPSVPGPIRVVPASHASLNLPTTPTPPTNLGTAIHDMSSNPMDDAEGSQWSCSQCTFSNHPSLDTCEICNMPRINIGYSSAALEDGSMKHIVL